MSMRLILRSTPLCTSSLALNHSQSYARHFHPSMAALNAVSYDQFLLFGASIIEQASTQERGFALAPALQQSQYAVSNSGHSKSKTCAAYIRRLDVVNRGFSGFNTAQALKVLPTIIPDPNRTSVRFMVILFGSNDACFLDAQNGQHVPLDQYKQNLVQILTHPAIEAHKSRLLLVTPPPIEERRLEHRVKSQGYTKLNRSNIVTKQYSDASREVASDLNVACVDLWTAFMSKAGWKPGDPLYGSQDLPENDALRSLIHDGLHFTPEAYKIFYDEIMKVIAKTWPDQTPEHLPYVVPAWDDKVAWQKEGLSMSKTSVISHD